MNCATTMNVLASHAHDVLQEGEGRIRPRWFGVTSVRKSLVVQIVQMHRNSVLMNEPG
jgi:hypothetical protein